MAVIIYKLRGNAFRGSGKLLPQFRIGGRRCRIIGHPGSLKPVCHVFPDCFQIDCLIVIFRVILTPASCPLKQVRHSFIRNLSADFVYGAFLIVHIPVTGYPGHNDVAVLVLTGFHLPHTGFVDDYRKTGVLQRPAIPVHAMDASVRLSHNPGTKLDFIAAAAGGCSILVGVDPI